MMEMPQAGEGLLLVVDFAVEQMGWLLPAVGVVALVWLAGWVWWRRRAARELERRIAVELVPSVDFDPSAADVRQAAAQLARVPAAAGALPRRASAVRVRLVCGEGGLLHYWWEGPERASGVLRLPAFPQQVEVVTDEPGAAQRVRFAAAQPLRKGGAW
ncbi:hypothetical protein AB0I82_35830 [Streptomyces sp. NPDC050315]|uniref:hypothetical protein n=1 Tax=Streptomyces sp. NPDC050315 TaxID=3155039 RepID=UPI0034123C69